MIKSSKMELKTIRANPEEWGVIPVSTLAPFTKITKKIRIGLITLNPKPKSINNQLILFLLVIAYKSYCLNLER